MPSHEQQGRGETRGAGAGPRRRRLVAIATSVALACAMVVYFGAQRGSGGGVLPVYSVVAAGDAPAGAAPLIRVGDGRHAPFEIVLRPDARPSDTVVAYAFTVGEPGAGATPLDAEVSLEPDGRVRVSGSARALRGVREVRVVLGKPTAIGTFVDAEARATSGASDPYVGVLSIPVGPD